MSSYLFVYGTLRRDAQHPMARYLHQQARWIGSASYQGKLYQVSDYPAVVSSRYSADTVCGEVYQLFTADLWSILDDYEECSPSFPAPTEYQRVLQTVYLSNGEAISAWIYLYNRPISGLKVIESGDFLI
ncbi:MAG: gamma-glutamylcyclotransferase [Methylomonas sp.]